MLAKTLFHGAVWGSIGRQEGLGSGSVLASWSRGPTGLSQPEGCLSASLWLQ